MAVLEIKRHFKQARQLVFEAWTKCENLEQWWGPKGFETKAKTFNLQPGGDFHYSFQQQGAAPHWGKFIFQSITPPHAIQFTNSFSDEHGNLTRAPFADAWPVQIQNAIAFEEIADGTIMTLKSIPVNASPEEEKTFQENLQNMRVGFDGTFDRLETFLSKSFALHQS